MRCPWINCFGLVHRHKYTKMNGINKEAPAGIQFFQKFSEVFCPRLRFNRLRWSVLRKNKARKHRLTEIEVREDKKKGASLRYLSMNWASMVFEYYQALVLFLTYLTYMTYHLTRKPISVVKGQLHRNCSAWPPTPGPGEAATPTTPPPNDYWCDWPPFNTTDANTLLGTLDSAFLFSYAGAMFISGMIAERVDLRYFLSIGMLLSGIFCYLFGLAKTLDVHNLSYYLLIQAGAGVAQTTGWPGTVAIVGKWFGNSKKGLIFGIWNSHTSLGNILGTLLAAEFVESDWALSFAYPGLVMGAVGFLVFLLLPAEPKCVGIVIEERNSPSRQPRRSINEDEPTQIIVGDQAACLRPNRHSANAPPPPESLSEPTERTALLDRRDSDDMRKSSEGSAVSLGQALAIPGVVEFALSLFFAKLVSYTFLYWLPLYIISSTDLTTAESGKLSTVFDVGGVAGAMLAGAVADACGCPGLVCAVFYVLSAPSLFAYQLWGASTYALNVSLLMVNGLLINAPYALITTAVSAELGTHSCLSGNSRALATVTAIIDGTGSVGAALGPMLAGVVSARVGWPQVFYMLIACNMLALLLLIRIVRTELAKLALDRRLAAQRVVRIE